MLLAVFGTLGLLFEILGAVALLALAVIVAMRFVNKDAAASWWHLGRTKVGQAGDYAKGVDPVAQMKQAIKDTMAELEGANKALIACNAMQSRLARQIEADQLMLGRLEGQVAKHIQEGLAQDNPKVVEKLKRIRDLRSAIAENNKQLELNAATYNQTLAQVNNAQSRISSAEQRASQLGVQLQMKEELAKVRSMAASFNSAGVGAGLDKVKQYEEQTRQRLDELNAQDQVMVDRGLVDDDEDLSPATDPELMKILDDIKGKTKA